MKKNPSRRYNRDGRAAAAAQTAHAILVATVELWRERPIDEVTLQEIATRAGVTVQTVLRHFGSRAGVLEACIARDPTGIRRERDLAPPGDLAGALRVLLDHYERDGDAVARTLALEGRVEGAAEVVAAGREAHRTWCARVFAPFLPPPGADGHDARLDAFVAATDLYLWKLLRRDLGRTGAETYAVLRALIEGLAGQARASA